MNYALYTVAALTAVATISVIMSIGKPRKPVTPEAAAVILLIQASIITLLVIAAWELS